MSISARLRRAAHNRLMAKRPISRHVSTLASLSRAQKQLLPKRRTAQSTLCRCKAIPAKGCHCTRSVPVALILETSPTRSALTCNRCRKGRHS